MDSKEKTTTVAVPKVCIDMLDQLPPVANDEKEKLKKSIASISSLEEKKGVIKALRYVADMAPLNDPSAKIFYKVADCLENS